MGSALILIGVIGIGLSWVLFMREPKPPKIALHPGSVSIEHAPSSVKLKPEETAQYSVPPSNPKYIAIPSIGIQNTPVLKLGLLKSGAIAAPGNIYEAGWYDGSALPGQNGATFIYGHVSSWSANGIFYDLKKVGVGDTIVITRGDSTTYTYKVSAIKTYPYNSVNMREVLSPIHNTQPGLNLMTCTGKIIQGTSEFSERLVVFSSLIATR